MKLAKVPRREDINFLFTNHIPRQLANRLIGWFSRIENPLLARSAIGVWRLFADLDLGEAATQRFNSLHECFTRRLKPGTRRVDPAPGIITSPCDAIVGACGRIAHDQLIQAKGLSYTVQELLTDPELAEFYRDGQFATLRLTSTMYHRFHAPYDCTIERLIYISGDTWNVNPAAVARIAKLFCKNERAVIPAVLPGSGAIVTLVAVAAILVASIRLHFIDVKLDARYRGPSALSCRASFRKGEEIGWFEHGSTMIVLAPKGVTICDSVQQGKIIRMGCPLMRFG